jgi:type I restriction enzyme S subunit
MKTAPIELHSLETSLREPVKLKTVLDLCSQGVLFVEDGNHGEYRPLADEFADHGTPFVRPDDLKGGRVDFSHCDRINDKALARIRKGKGQGGDILFTHRATVGRMAKTSADDPPFIANPGVTVWRSLAPTVLDPLFLFYFMQTTAFMNQVWAEAGNTDTFPYVSLTQQRGLWLALPSLSTQQAIASVLGALDDKIDLNHRMNGTLEAMARAIFKDWFVDFGPTRAKMEGGAPYLAPDLWAMFPDRFDGEGRPEGWKSETVLTQANWINGAAYKNMHFVEPTLGLPVVKIAELKSGVTPQTKFTNTDLGDRYRIKDGEILFSWSGNPDTSIDTFIWTGGPAWLNQHIFAIRENGHRKLAYVYAMLKWLNPVFAELARNKQTIGLGHVTKEDLGRLQVVVPSPPIELEFDRIVVPILDRHRAALFENRALAATRDLLLPKLMSGEIRLKGVEQIVEAAL